MQITITDTAFYVIIGLLFIAFLPHIYLFTIFAMMSIADLIEYLSNLLNKHVFIKYIFPISILFLFYFTFMHTLRFEHYYI